MDGEAVHGCAPLGGCVRHGPGAVGGDGARAPPTEGAVALRAVAGAASGSLHSAQRTAVSASHGGRALRRSDCTAPSPHRFAPASSTCAAGMDSPCNGHFSPAPDGGNGVVPARGGGRVRRGRQDHEGTGRAGDAVVRGRAAKARPAGPGRSFSGGGGDGGRLAATPDTPRRYAMAQSAETRRRVRFRALGAAHGGVCVTRRSCLAAQRLPRLFGAPIRAGFEHMRRGHGFALQ